MLAVIKKPFYNAFVLMYVLRFITNIAMMLLML